MFLLILYQWRDLTDLSENDIILNTLHQLHSRSAAGAASRVGPVLVDFRHLLRARADHQEIHVRVPARSVHDPASLGKEDVLICKTQERMLTCINIF